MILFGAWAFQQTLLNRANEAMQNIDLAETRFETYQSNNTIFNALNAAAPPTASTEIRRFQTINYEYALTHLALIREAFHRIREDRAVRAKSARTGNGTSL